MAGSKFRPSVTERLLSSESTEQLKKKTRALVPDFAWACSILFSTLWLAPALFIVSINYLGQTRPRVGVVGPSIGCLSRSQRCRINFQDPNQIQQAQRLAELDKNAQGALQLAAKALELWFVSIAISLVFTMVKVLARRTSRQYLPIRFIYLHTALADLRAIAKWQFWEPMKAALKKFPPQIRTWPEETPREDDGNLAPMFWRKTRLYLVPVFVAFVSIVCSLMGPAAAVLVLPTMQWTQINVNTASPPSWPDTIGAGQPPLDLPVPGCGKADFTGGNFSCLADFYSAFIDTMAASAVATDNHAFQEDKAPPGTSKTLVVLPSFQEANVTFSANLSGKNPAIWVPLRQTLRGMSGDVGDYDLATSMGGPPRPGYPDSDLFNKSVQARLQRTSLTLGMQVDCHLNSTREKTVFTYILGTEQAVRCYKGQSDTRCIPSGSGWSDILQAASSFSVREVPPVGPTRPSHDINVAVFSRSTSLTMPNSALPCGGNETCDWDWATAFSNQASSPGVKLNGPLQTIQYFSPNYEPTASIWCAHTYASTAAGYVLDPSKVANIFRRVDLNVNGNNGTLAIGTPQYVHPDWILAGWAVDRNGSVGAQRYAAAHLIIAYQSWMSYGEANQSFADFVNINRFIAIQSLSLIPFNSTSVPPAGRGAAAAAASSSSSLTRLSTGAEIQAYRYDLSSNTAKLGVVVVMLGCLLVVLQTVLHWRHAEDIMDATEILESILNRYVLAGDSRAPNAGEGYPALVVDDVSRDIGFRA